MILQPTRVVPRKGIEHAIHLVRMLDDPRCKLVVSHEAGDEGLDYRNQLAELAKGSRVDVRFIATRIGDIRRLNSKGQKMYTLWDLYPHANLVTYPSLYEGFGLPILEAMACGVPVVISDASCMPEIAGEAALALVASGQDEWATGIQNLLEDPSRRMKMVAAGFLRARQFSWRVAAEQLADVFNNLLEKL